MSKNFIGHLCRYLRQSGALTEQQEQGLIKEFSGQARLDFETFILDQGFVTRRSLLEALSFVYGVPAFDAVGYFFDHYLVTRFPKDFLKRTTSIPLSVDDDAIVVMVTAIPNQPAMLEEIGQYVSWDVTCLVSLYQDIQDAIDEYYDESLTISEMVEDLSPQERRERSVLTVADRIIKAPSQE